MNIVYFIFLFIMIVSFSLGLILSQFEKSVSTSTGNCENNYEASNNASEVEII